MNFKKFINLFSKKIILLLTLYFIISFVSAVVISFVSIYFSNIIDSAQNDDINTSFWYVFLTIILTIIWFLLNVLLNYLSSLTIKMFNINLRKKIDEKIHHLEYKEFTKKSVSNYLSWYVNDINQLETQFLNPLFDAMSAFLIIPTTLGFILYKNYILFLFALISVIVCLFITLFFKKPLSQKNLMISNGNESFSQKTKDLLSGFFVFWALGYLATFKQKSENNSEIIEKKKYKLNILAKFANWFMNFFGNILHCFFLALAAYLLYKKLITIGTIFAILILLDTLYNNLATFFGSFTLIYSSKIILNKYDFQDNYIASQGLKIVNFNIIEFKNVTFGYDEHIILKNFNCKIEKGKKYAIVGASGIGKSTLLNLLLGIYDNYEGEILINGVSLKTINKDDWRNKFSIMNQHPYLFADNIINNITLWQEYDQQKLEKIIKDTHIENLIKKIDLKNDIIKDNSENISGGEKQRIAIARTLYMEKEILLLDEFTNALDADNRTKIESLIFNNNKTILHVSHNIDINNLYIPYDQIIKIEHKQN